MKLFLLHHKFLIQIECLGKIKYKELVELQNEYKIKVYG